MESMIAGSIKNSYFLNPRSATNLVGSVSDVKRDCSVSFMGCQTPNDKWVAEQMSCAGYLLIRPDLSDKRELSCFFTS